MAADHAFEAIEVKVHEHFRDRRLASITVPDTSNYAIEMGHKMANLKKIARDHCKDNYITYNDLKQTGGDSPIRVKYANPEVHVNDAEEPGVPLPDRWA